MTKQLILCNCAGSQELDKDALEAATGLTCSAVHSGLCTTQTDATAQAIAAGDAILCCRRGTAPLR